MEQEIIRWIQSECETSSEFVSVGIGDDAAIITPSGPLVLTTDTIAEGTHFDQHQMGLANIGRKAMAVNLSDLAAMGARPRAALVTFQLPYELNLAQVKTLFLGMKRLATEYHVAIVGGDTNRWSGPLTVGATLIGSAYQTNKTESVFWSLAGGRPGDGIWVSGSFGGSILRHHFEFEPQNRLAKHLVTHHQITAATDVSDSLAHDLSQLAGASHTGFEIDSRLIPISDDAVQQSASTGRSPLDHALYDGEDFQLICCASPDQEPTIGEDTELSDNFRRIGRLTETTDFTMINDAGSSEPLIIKGFQH